jgi:N-acetylmuramoyl-L-alanine amidase
MTRTNSLPLLFKRAAKIFLICIASYLFSGFVSTPENPEDIKKSVRTVVIDPGHGGRDSGAVGKISKEKDIALDISLKLGKLIEDNVKDVKVIYTRKSDVYPELHKRAKIANDANADLFISIHVNASTKSSPYGTSSHVLGLHRSDEHFDVAVRENSVILLEEDYETNYQGFDPTSPESYIMFSLMQKTYLKQSVEFASLVQNQFKSRAQRNDRGVVQQGLLVLAQTAMPAVLIETGFISNPSEEKYLNTDQGQDIIASAIYRAFKEYKSKIQENSQFEIDQSEIARQEALQTEENPAKVVIPDSEHLQFMIQIMSSRSLVDSASEEFKGYKNVVAVPNGKYYKYAINGGWTYHEALEECKIVRDDFPGAFVISVEHNKIIPLSEALLKINM